MQDSTAAQFGIQQCLLVNIRQLSDPTLTDSTSGDASYSKERSAETSRKLPPRDEETRKHCYRDEIGCEFG